MGTSGRVHAALFDFRCCRCFLRLCPSFVYSAHSMFTPVLVLWLWCTFFCVRSFHAHLLRTAYRYLSGVPFFSTCFAYVAWEHFLAPLFAHLFCVWLWNRLFFACTSSRSCWYHFFLLYLRVIPGTSAPPTDVTSFAYSEMPHLAYEV